MTGDTAIRRSTVAAVVLVAAVAAVASYEHAYQVIAAGGERGAVARIYPLTIDGLIYAASMVLMSAARRGAPAPSLARWALAAGISATLAANVLAGLGHGLLGAIVAAWPAPALVISYELLMHLVRTAAVSGPEPVRPDIPVPQADIPPEPERTPEVLVRSEADTEADALSVLADDPDISGAELGRRLGVSARHGSRLRRQLMNGSTERKDS